MTEEWFRSLLRPGDLPSGWRKADERYIYNRALRRVTAYALYYAPPEARASGSVSLIVSATTPLSPTSAQQEARVGSWVWFEEKGEGEKGSPDAAEAALGFSNVGQGQASQGLSRAPAVWTEITGPPLGEATTWAELRWPMGGNRPVRDVRVSFRVGAVRVWLRATSAGSYSSVEGDLADLGHAIASRLT
ncbi:MAG: hypothetical protein QOF51_2166 [Chloroflexota bacterium]|nr:hypothetical protein [Chloroflexota bacterium]